MEPVSILKEQVEGAHGILEQTMADVTPEQAHWSPPGVANPLGATYAHLVSSEDMFVNGMLKGGAPIMASTFVGKSGLSEPPPMGGEDYIAWTRRVKVDLPQLKEYAQAVYSSTSEWLSSLTTADLGKEIDLSGFGLGKQTLAWVLGNIIIWHVDAHCGEVSCLKGLQGAKGFPF